MADEGVADVDELFALPPEAFTAARDGLARRLRAEGDREAAADVKALRRPTVAAWALNQLVRRHPGEVDALVAAGAALADAQQQALDGSPGGLREAAKARTAAVRRLTGLAEAVLGDRATEAHRRELSDALTAASADPSLGESLREGRLREPPTAAAGSTFGFGLGSAEPAPPRPRAARRAGTAKGARAEADAVAARVAARQAAVAAAAERREEAEQARVRAAAAREAVPVAEAKVAALVSALDQARDEAAQAEAGAAAAEAQAAEADERARAAEAAVVDLEP